MGAESGGKICSAFFGAEGEDMRRFWSPSSSCSRVASFFFFLIWETPETDGGSRLAGL